MKVKLMAIITKIVSSAAALTLLVATANANSTCIFLSYQPDMPNDLLD